MPTDTLTDEKPAERGEIAVPRPLAPGDFVDVAFEREARLPFPPRTEGVVERALPGRVKRELKRADRDITRLAASLAETPQQRRRASLIGSVLLNTAMLALLAIYGRVHIFVPNKPAESISVVFVDLPPAAVPDLRDPEVAPEPEPEPEPTPEPEQPVEPEPEPEPESEPEQPPLDLTPEPDFTRPAEIEDAPFIPDEPAPAAAPEVEDRPGDNVVDGEQAPVDEADPLLTVEPEARRARAEEDAGDEKEEDKEDGAGERAAGDNESRDQAPIAERRTPEPAKPSGDDLFDEEPVFSGRRFTLPQVDLPKGDTPAKPGSSGVMAIFCPEEFKDKEKAAECAGRTEIRSGWRPGASGEDFSKAASILRQKNEEGDFSGDNVRYGNDLARAANQRARDADIEDFRKGQSQDLGKTGLAPEPAGTAVNIGASGAEPSWTRRDDPLVNKKDVEKLRKELEEAERRANPDGR